MESGIKYENLRNVLHNCKTAADTLKVCARVKGSVVVAKLKLCKNVIVKKHGLGEEVAAVDYSVTYCLDLSHIGDNADLSVGESVDNDTNRIGMGGDSKVFLGASTLDKILVLKNTYRLTDTLANTLCGNGIISGIKKLIFK
jgi:hypothetical protein